jgi:hypothetical protein
MKTKTCTNCNGKGHFSAGTSEQTRKDEYHGRVMSTWPCPCCGGSGQIPENWTEKDVDNMREPDGPGR